MTCSGPLSIRQVSFRGCLPRKKIYLSLVTRKDCFQALKWLPFWMQTFFWSLLLSTQKGYFSGGEIEATTGNTSVFTDYEMAVEVYLKQETKFKIRNFFCQDIMIIWILINRFFWLWSMIDWFGQSDYFWWTIWNLDWFPTLHSSDK